MELFHFAIREIVQEHHSLCCVNEIVAVSFGGLSELELLDFGQMILQKTTTVYAKCGNLHGMHTGA